MISGRYSALLPLLAATLLTSACHKAKEAPANNANVVEPESVPPPPPANIVNEATPAPPPKKTALVPPDDYQPSSEEQMREDAEATGMTSRLHPGEPAQEPSATPGGNSSQH